jgi:hypothetical protein
MRSSVLKQIEVENFKCSITSNNNRLIDGASGAMQISRYPSYERTAMAHQFW